MKPIHNLNIKEFDKYEHRGAYHWEWYSLNKHSYKDKIHMIRLHLPRTGSVLDIGGGDGVLAYYLFEHGLRATCIDSNAVAIELGREMTRRKLYGGGVLGSLRRRLSRAGIRPLPLAQRYEAGELGFVARSIFEYDVEEPFDYIVCHEVIEHVPEPHKLVAWIHRNMRVFAIISTPDVTDRPPHRLDYNSWTPQSFAEFLSPHRFEFIFQDGRDMYVKLYK